MNPRELQLKEIREVVARVVPDVMEIAFGCQVRFKSNGEIGTIFKFYKELDGIFKLSVRVQNMSCYPSDGDVEILGRPIRLADILAAMNATLKTDEFSLQAWREIITGNKYNLLSDDLTAQSHELIAFLHNVLV